MTPAEALTLEELDKAIARAILDSDSAATLRLALFNEGLVIVSRAHFEELERAAWIGEKAESYAADRL